MVVAAVAAALQDVPLLQNLDLSDNGISAYAVRALNANAAVVKPDWMGSKKKLLSTTVFHLFLKKSCRQNSFSSLTTSYSDL